MGLSCSNYTDTLCDATSRDDYDFSAQDDCCLCGGGQAPTVTPTSSSPTVSPPPSVTLSPTSSCDAETFDQLRDCSAVDGTNIMVHRKITFNSAIIIHGISVHITGDNATLDGDGRFRLFRVENGGALRLETLNIVNGNVRYENGGAIQVAGTSSRLSMIECRVADNSATSNRDQVRNVPCSSFFPHATI